MTIDWSTFALEMINFLALVWILKRFLYKPVLDVLARRRADIDRIVAEAKETDERAAALKARFENRLADWEKEKGAARSRFEAELAAERERQMLSLAKGLAEKQERIAAQEAHELEELRREVEGKAMAQARRFASALLSRLAGPDLEERLVEIFIEDFANLPEEKLVGLRAAAGAQGAHATVTSAFALGEARRRGITEAIGSRLGLNLPVDFNEDGRLLAGSRVSVGPWQLNLTLADELASFAAAADHAG